MQYYENPCNFQKQLPCTQPILYQKSVHSNQFVDKDAHLKAQYPIFNDENQSWINGFGV